MGMHEELKFIFDILSCPGGQQPLEPNELQARYGLLCSDAVASSGVKPQVPWKLFPP